MNVYVKYCGGCNPRYDRKAFAHRIMERFPEYSFSETYNDPDVSMVICGCQSACADKMDAVAPYGVITLSGEDGFERAVEFLGNICPG